MSAQIERDATFWKLVEALERADVLRHVMIIGTWAEWLYTDYFEQVAGVGEVRVDIGKTHDIDVYFRNYLMEINGAERLKGDLYDAGFLPGSDYKGTFFLGGIEVEFLAGTAGVGEGVVEIPSVGIKAERLSDLSLFELAWVEKNSYRICIPTPASYVVQKLFINPTRRPEHKRPQDIRKVEILLQAMEGVPGQMESLEQLIEKLPASKRNRILEVAKDNSIALPWNPASD